MSGFYGFDLSVRNLKLALSVITTTDLDRYEKAIALTWHCLKDGSTQVQKIFKKISQAEIEALVAGQSRSLKQPGFSFIPDTTDLRAMLRSTAAFLRALEEVLIAGFEGGDPVSSQDWRVKIDHLDCYLIPMGPRLWTTSRDPATDKRPFKQRGLRRHRIVPASIDNSSVNVMPLPGIKFRGEVQLGAVLFPNLTLVIPQEGEPGYNPNDTFIVSGVNCSEMNRVVEQAVRGSFTAGCAATVFPELTIDMDRRDMIQDLLKTKPWFYAADNADGTSMRTPRLVLAGSWHVESDGAFQNQATIFDGNGKHLHTYAKRLDFTDEAGRSEGIEYGEAFPLFVFDDAMVSCAICLDFCNLDGPSPYEDLPADLILVPSYGKDSTMLSHLNTAYRVQVAQKTRTFVVQQRPVDDREPVDYLGYVLPAPVRLPQSDATRERDVWRVCST